MGGRRLGILHIRDVIAGCLLLVVMVSCATKEEQDLKSDIEDLKERVETEKRAFGDERSQREREIGALEKEHTNIARLACTLESREKRRQELQQERKQKGVRYKYIDEKVGNNVC